MGRASWVPVRTERLGRGLGSLHEGLQRLSQHRQHQLACVGLGEDHRWRLRTRLRAPHLHILRAEKNPGVFLLNMRVPKNMADTGNLRGLCRGRRSPTHWWVAGCLPPENLAAVITLCGQREDRLSTAHMGSQELLKNVYSRSQQAWNWIPY